MRLDLRARALLWSLLLLGPPACGPGAPAPPAPGGWPLSFDVPAILGYVAHRSGGGVAEFLAREGWLAEGLDPTRPEVLLLLDPGVLGAPVGLLLPVTDGPALERSLLGSGLVEPLGEGRYRIVVPPDHPARVALRVLQAGPALSVASLMDALQDASPISMTVRFTLRDGWAMLLPSFEAEVVARRVLEQLPLGKLSAGALAAAIDIDRVRAAFHELFEAGEQRMLLALGGVGAEGAILANLFAEGPGVSLPPPQVVAALFEMLALGDIDAVGAEWTSAEGAAPGEQPGAPFSATLRGRRVRSSPLTDLFAALRPAPAPVGGTGLVLAAEGPSFGAALASWCAPLAAAIEGPGPPAERWQAALGGLLAPWSGQVAARWDEGGVVLALGQRPGGRLDPVAWQAWVRDLVSDLGLGDSGADGPDAGEPAPRVLDRDEALLLRFGEPGAGAMEEALASLRATGPEAGPALRFVGPSVSAGLGVDGLSWALTVERTDGPGVPR